MKTEIRLLPLNGIEIEGYSPILFNMSMDEVEHILGAPKILGKDDKRFFYDEWELRIDFDNDGKVEFIECIFGRNSKQTKPMMYGNEVFAVRANDLLSILSEKNNGAIDDSEAEYGYGFLEISVGVWRENVPDDIMQSIDEEKQAGTYEESKEWLDADLEKSEYFCTIGIGKKDYYR